MLNPVNLVCSAKPRPSVQKGAKGSQWWTRDVFHVAGEGNKTLCGVNSSEWLKMDARDAQDVINDAHCCSRCAGKVQIEYKLQKAS
jgi:hypothetical protein